MLKRVNFRPILVLMLCIGIPMWGLAGTTGKIAGVIKEVESGNPLPGVNVVIEGTTMGAATDLQGNYFIINVSPGNYNLKASIIGYTPETVTNAIVYIDRTTNINFNLKETVIDIGGEVVVTAEREKIRKDVSFSQHSISAAEVMNVPTSPDLREVMAVVAGVSQDIYGFIAMRGGAIDEVGVYLDGFNNNDTRVGYARFNVPKSSIQEIQVLKGGFNAEYGRVRSGVINMITKEGGSTYNFSIDTRFSPNAKKHYGSKIFSPGNYWWVGRYLSMEPTGDRNNDGIVDFIGWNQVLADKGGEFNPNNAVEAY